MSNSMLVEPNAADTLLAITSSKRLSRFAKLKEQEVQATFHSDDSEEMVEIPASAFRLFVEILNQMASGNAVALIPKHAELSTQEAAEFLNVSRPFVIKLIENKELPCKKVGTHRRLLFSDVEAYKRKVDAQRSEALQELVDQAQELDLGY